MEKNKNNEVKSFLGKKMSRKEAIKKVGITALTATSLMFLTTNANGAGPSSKPGNNRDGTKHGRNN